MKMMQLFYVHATIVTTYVFFFSGLQIVLHSKNMKRIFFLFLFCFSYSIIFSQERPILNEEGLTTENVEHYFFEKIHSLSAINLPVITQWRTRNALHYYVGCSTIIFESKGDDYIELKRTIWKQEHPIRAVIYIDSNSWIKPTW